MVEGHCDERGSAEYNLGLGDRRATAAKEFLVQLGVPADRLKTDQLRQGAARLHGDERSLLAEEPPGTLRARAVTYRWFIMREPVRPGSRTIVWS